MKLLTTVGLIKVKTAPNGRCYTAGCSDAIAVITRFGHRLDDLVGYCEHHGIKKLGDPQWFSLERWL